jgi:hypothetical protein
MFWIYRVDLLRQMRSILVSFGRIKRCQRNAGVRARIAFPDPAAGGAGQKLARGSILDVAVNIRRGSPDYGPPDPIARTTKVNPLGIYSK